MTKKMACMLSGISEHFSLADTAIFFRKQETLSADIGPFLHFVYIVNLSFLRAGRAIKSIACHKARLDRLSLPFQRVQALLKPSICRSYTIFRFFVRTVPAHVFTLESLSLSAFLSSSSVGPLFHLFKRLRVSLLTRQGVRMRPKLAL